MDSGAAAWWDDVETIADNSYLDFHAKGLQYICLKRDPLGETHKVYFLPSNPAGIVNPHNHRYAFETELLAGRVVDQRYDIAKPGQPYLRRRWFTPLDGGEGFGLDGNPCQLQELPPDHFARPGSKWATSLGVIHTLRPLTESVIYLVQRPSIRGSSAVYLPEGEPLPSLSGLYRKPSIDTVISLLRTIQELMPAVHSNKPTPPSQGDTGQS